AGGGCGPNVTSSAPVLPADVRAGDRLALAAPAGLVVALAPDNGRRREQLPPVLRVSHLPRVAHVSSTPDERRADAGPRDGAVVGVQLAGPAEREHHDGRPGGDPQPVGDRALVVAAAVA